MELNAASYGLEVQAILDGARGGLSSLVTSSKPATAELKNSMSLSLFAHSAHPAGALSGLWLYADCFDEGHSVAQEDKSREGSLWHAIAHRREPDYWNSSYWYRQAGSHLVYPAILEEARRLSAMPGAGFRGVNSSKWEPHIFVEYCEEAARSGGEREQFALRLQRAEWEILFDYCARKSPD
jgi:hypothetical protein